jgi:hypothetical protein
MFPTHVRAVILDANIDPVRFTTSVEDAMLNLRHGYRRGVPEGLGFVRAGGAGELRSGRSGRRSATSAGPTGSLAPRTDTGAERACAARVGYGDAQIQIWSTLGKPVKWRGLADELNQAANGDGSAMSIPVRKGRLDLLAILVPAAALQCADKHLPPPGLVLTWPTVTQHLTTSNFLGSVERLVALGAVCFLAVAQCESVHRPMDCHYFKPDLDHR